MFHILYRTHEHKFFVDVHANFFHFLGIEHESASQHHELGDEPFFSVCVWLEYFVVHNCVGHLIWIIINIVYVSTDINAFKGALFLDADMLRVHLYMTRPFAAAAWAWSGVPGVAS